MKKEENRPMDDEVVDEVAAYRRKKQAEKVKRTFAEVEMLTDDQLEQAVFLSAYEDKTMRDVGKFFLQRLSARDPDRAYRVFLEWSGERKAE